MTTFKNGHFFKRKEIWVPTWKTCLLTLLAGAAICFFLIRTAVPFLSPNRPIGADVLVIEGWIDEVGLQATMDLVQSNQYKLIISSGGVIEKGITWESYGTYANFGKARLEKFGYKGTNLIAVSSNLAPRDRTYHNALAVRQYLLTNTPYRSLDLLSSNTHSRRSWFLYERACLPEIQVGIYAVKDPNFSASNWYKTSYGIRNVMTEAIGFTYARLFFNPSKYDRPAAELK